MITILKWFFRLLIWIPLYYIALNKIFEKIIDISILNESNFKLETLYLVIGMSFSLSFIPQILSWENIKKHLYLILPFLIIPITTWIINNVLIIINWISSLTNAPLIKDITFKIIKVQNTGCYCEDINGLGKFYLISTLILIIFFIIGTYSWDATIGDCNSDGDWDYDDYD